MTLRLHDITKSFGAYRVLHGVSTEIRPGEVTAIVGDNGAGKSTLLKIMAGIHQPDKGSISVYGDELTTASPSAHRRAGIEMVLQDLGLAKQQNVPANLFMGRELYHPMTGLLSGRSMKQKTAEALHKLGIDIQNLNLPVENLSGGQQQAIAIARAVLFDPKVLLLDEPTAALAVREVEKVLDLIRQQKQHGRIVILVSHRLNDVFAVANRIIVMKQGSIISDLPVSETSIPKTVEKIVS
jgi:ABC-type sugar transport system ATPase subunit